MKHVLQTKQKKQEHQNCLNAAIASILELDLNEVPEFNLIEDHAAWWRAAQDWLKRLGFQMFLLHLNEHTAHAPLYEDIPAILVGKNHKGILHAVVGCARNKGNKIDYMIHHDPADGNGIESVDSIIYLVPIHPEKLVIRPTYLVTEYWPAFVDRTGPPRTAVVNKPEDALKLDWLTNREGPMIPLEVDLQRGIIHAAKYVVATIKEQKPTRLNGHSPA